MFNSPDSIKGLSVGESFRYGDIEVLFSEVISDSRCPKKVMCVRAGEAKVEVKVYVNDELVKTRELIFFASGFVDEKNMQIYYTDNWNISGISLDPYPDYPSSLGLKDYKLSLKVNKNK